MSGGADPGGSGSRTSGAGEKQAEPRPGECFTSEYGIEYYIIAVHNGWAWCQLVYRGTENQPEAPRTFKPGFFSHPEFQRHTLNA